MKKHQYHLLLLLIVTITFGQTVQYDFVFDDEFFILKNRFVQSWDYLPELLTSSITKGSHIESNLYRPLQSVTHLIDFSLWGAHSSFHHFTNILIHLFLAFSFFKLLKTLFRDKVAFLGALIFSIHPLQHQAVAFISGRGDLLGISFLCLGLVYSRSFILGSLFFLLAMFSKESMAMFPALYLIYSYLRDKKINYKSFIFYGGLGSLYVVLRLTLLNFINTLNFYNTENILTENFIYRLYTYLTTVPKSFLLWFIPYDLHHERSWTVFTDFNSFPVLGGFILIIALGLTALYSWKRNKFVSLGLAWYFVASIPTSNLFVTINALFYDHWFIFPGIGLIIAFCSMIERLPNLNLKIITPPFALILCPITMSYNTVWKNAISLNTHIIHFEKRSSKAHHNLAMAYSDKGYENLAYDHYHEAIRINPKSHQSFHNIGMIHYHKNKFNEAIKYYKKSLEINPNSYYSNLYIAKAYQRLGLIEDAQFHLKRINGN